VAAASLVLLAAAGLPAQPALPPQPPAPAGTARRAYQDGQALERALDWQQARARFRDAIDLALRDNDSTTLADARYRLGITYWARNHYDSAIVYLEQARDVRVRLTDRNELGRVYNGLGASFYQLGIYEQALNNFVLARELRQEAGDSVGLVRTLTNIGRTYLDWGQHVRARRVLDDAVRIAEKASAAPAALGYALNSLAELSIAAGDYPAARRFISESRAAYARPHALVSAADSVDSWEINAGAEGLLLLREGHPAEATAILDKVLASAKSRGSIRGQARALLHLGECSFALGNIARARQRFDESLTLSRSVNQRVLALEALRELSDLESAANDPSSSLRHLRSYQALRDTIFDQDAALRIASREAKAETEKAERTNRVLEAQQKAQQLVISRQRVVVVLVFIILGLAAALVVVLSRFTRRESARAEALAKANAELASLNEELRRTNSEVRTLSGLIPICANCKKVRDDRGYWEAVETFVAERSNATFSHGICQSCGPLLYGELWPEQTPG
jgi:tetratricopeptide (TPR) repeat protein